MPHQAEKSYEEWRAHNENASGDFSTLRQAGGDSGRNDRPGGIPLPGGGDRIGLRWKEKLRKMPDPDRVGNLRSAWNHLPSRPSFAFHRRGGQTHRRKGAGGRCPSGLRGSNPGGCSDLRSGGESNGQAGGKKGGHGTGHYPESRHSAVPCNACPPHAESSPGRL